ncbi:NADH dehydrogenase [ubiquinone] 1 beta subcomplex subunit [Fasciola gigantica]|uniref:NADH dehydrogenase [ubiquinone] 1 beta subcomplex subunit 9 n=2 Tax=Fasciola TaxID=6191 RepID=A0A4E0R7V6_FASHE|nr:putative mitochondrial electron transport nadh to ubiquinone [Fasciola hepatica]TPP56678.1 NADH dehydrogenase [ubiquinone] 1 beta subcomplex subunit [Fasciola gigantica]
MARPPVPPSYLRTKLVPHAQQVCQLYKAALYDLRAKKFNLVDFRYHAVLLRARFEENRDIKDPILAKRLLEEGWEEYHATRCPFPFKYPSAPGGVAYERGSHVYDIQLDAWHPLEKLQYPDYFARREKRKKEFIDRWVARYGAQEEQPVS